MDELLNSEQWKYSLQAENSLIGCLLVDPEKTLHLIREIISADDFQSEAGKAVYRAAAALIDNSKPCDPVLIQDEAARQGSKLSAEFCAEAMQLYTTTANAAATARVIHEAAMKRASHQVANSLLQDELTTLEAIGRLQEILAETGGSVRDPIEAASAFLDSVNAAMTGKQKPFLPTGYKKLDEQLSGGLIKGGLITIAGRSSMGKTAIGLNISDRVASTGAKVLYASLEMRENELYARRASILSGLNSARIQQGHLDGESEEYKRFVQSVSELSERKLFVFDTPSASLEEIEKAARCIDDLDLLIVDHIGMIKQADLKSSRYMFMLGITHTLKQLALSLRIPVVALCQLNREVERRENKQPSLADLRDSGSIEEDSDAVILLFRPAYYMPESERPKPYELQDLDLIVAKNRHGMCGTVTLNFCPVNGRILEKETYR